MNAPTQLISQLPLKQMDGTLLFPGILAAAAASKHDLADIGAAMSLASYLHRNQTRANRGDLPRTPYIEHPLRGALRAYRYGVCSPSLVIGVILHDTVEDNPFELAGQIAGIPTDDEEEARVTSFEYIRMTFGPDVESIVRGMTNEISVPGLTRAQKHSAYLEKVVKAIEDPYVAVAKFIDWVDNAVGLHHNIAGARNGMIKNLAGKYLPLAAAFHQRLDQDDVRALVSVEGHKQMLLHLEIGEVRLVTLLTGGEVGATPAAA
tara:strand:- start:1539 stop:2327 length:789 start_codon:yes stop_codon:yes gene_type:complete